MNTISNILYWISTGLLVPVIVLLIFFFLRALVMIGGFFNQYLQERKVSAEMRSIVDNLTPDSLDMLTAENRVIDRSQVGEYARAIVMAKDSKAKVELLLSDYEVAVEKNISTSKVLTKMGPILGLMGTLIPMGPALVGLASGDIASMAYNMQVAFATTVVGLTVSAIGFLTQQTKERWAAKNISMLNYIADMISDESETKE
ncbi:MAG: MotA/TolQ/ExbB proton channel family protein [Lepagella sp.]